LNAVFYIGGFSEEERVLIIPTNITSSVSSENISDPENTIQADTVQDNIFILNKEEIYRYMPNNQNRKSEYTNYASMLLKAASDEESYYLSWYDYYYNYRFDPEAYQCWWVRSDEESYYSPVVRPDGSLFEEGQSMDERCGVRPALWVDLSSLHETTQ